MFGDTMFWNVLEEKTSNFTLEKPALSFTNEFLSQLELKANPIFFYK